MLCELLKNTIKLEKGLNYENKPKKTFLKN